VLLLLLLLLLLLHLLLMEEEEEVNANGVRGSSMVIKWLFDIDAL
jgi:hypothetical protein